MKVWCVKDYLDRFYTFTADESQSSSIVAFLRWWNNDVQPTTELWKQFVAGGWRVVECELTEIKKEGQ